MNLHILSALGPFLLDELYKIPLYFPLVSVNTCACVCEVSITAAASLSSLQSVRDQGEEYSIHSLQPNITLSLCWAHFWRGTPFYPTNKTGMTHSIWTPALFFFFWESEFFFFNSHNRPAFIWALTSDACFKNTQGTVL